MIETLGQEKMEPEKLDLASLDIAAEKRAELLRLFPEVRTEGGKIDFDRLRLALGETVDVGKERYGMNWPGKADCFKAIQRPSLGTLRPVRDESVNFDETENLIIEGDNLEVLKLLQKAYQGKVKMIYIDPPYNTGNDFIYPDNYSENLQTYLEYTGQVDSEGRKFSNNTDKVGRFHSKWMSMMYPRLSLAHNLLRNDGAIFISIDENEIGNLRKLCDEIFGEENHIEDLVWAQNTTHSQSPLYSTNHEYVVVYARNSEILQSRAETFHEPKPGYSEVASLVQELNQHFPDLAQIESALATLMEKHKKEYEATLVELGLPLDAETEKQDPWRGIYAYKNAEYRDSEFKIVSDRDAERTDAKIMIWQSGDASAPAAKQAASTKDPNSPNFRYYNPSHPRTGAPCPHPKTGWRWPQSWPSDSRDSFETLEGEGRIAWGADESTVPRVKRFLHEVETNVAKSFFYDHTDGEKQVADILGRPALFPNPKPTTLISRLITHICEANSLVLDFFAGSGTTAQAILEHNRVNRASCRFILVQLPEIIDPKNKDTEAAAQFCDDIHRPRTISEITKERVRRFAVSYATKASSGQMKLLEPSTGSEDLGFRVLKLATSNFNVWNASTESTTPDALAGQLELQIDHVQPHRSGEDLLYEILLKSGFPPTTPIESLAIEGKTVYSVTGYGMLICLERGLTHELIRAIAERKPSHVVCLDEGFAGNDQLKTNAVLIMKSKGVTKFQTI